MVCQAPHHYLMCYVAICMSSPSIIIPQKRVNKQAEDKLEIIRDEKVVKQGNIAKKTSSGGIPATY